jgi:uncharacterized RDD family membrane protein YckC
VDRSLVCARCGEPWGAGGGRRGLQPGASVRGGVAVAVAVHAEAQVDVQDELPAAMIAASCPEPDPVPHLLPSPAVLPAQPLRRPPSSLHGYQPKALSQVRALAAATRLPALSTEARPGVPAGDGGGDTPGTGPRPPESPRAELEILPDTVAAVPAADEAGPLRPARPEPGVPGLEVAGFFRRLAANLVDLALVGLVLWGVGVGVARGLGLTLPVVSRLGLDDIVEVAVNQRATLLAVALPAAGLLVLYFFAFHTVLGQTPGKRLVNVRVVDRRGRPPGGVRLLVRLIGSALSVATCWAGFLWLAFDRHKRGLHDHLAGTWVVIGPGRPSRSAPGAAEESPGPGAEGTAAQL